MKPGMAKRMDRARRIRRTRKRVFGTSERPRLAVSRTNKHIYCQVIDDVAGRTLAAASSTSKEMREMTKGMKKTEVAALIGERIARLSLEKGITRVVFDRRYARYHGRVKAVAEGARKGGLQF